MRTREHDIDVGVVVRETMKALNVLLESSGDGHNGDFSLRELKTIGGVRFGKRWVEQGVHNDDQHTMGGRLSSMGAKTSDQ
jgi:hypothetical protein